MPVPQPRSIRSKLWRGTKFVFAAWGVAVACIILTTVVGHVAFGPLAAEWLLDHRAYSTPLFFLLGLIVAVRWLK